MDTYVHMYTYICTYNKYICTIIIIKKSISKIQKKILLKKNKNKK